MKKGRDLVTVAAEIVRQKKTKKDYIVSPTALEMGSFTNVLKLMFSTHKHSIKANAHRQLATKLNIPLKYYNRMKDNDQLLLTRNVNRWLQDEKEHRLVRTLDNSVRAYLSKGYRMLDNYDLSEAIIPLLMKAKCKIHSCEITENRFYLKALSERIYDDVKIGDVVQTGVIICNSEIGLGELAVDPYILTLACMNGMAVRTAGFHRRHVGRRYVHSEDVSEFYRDETKEADDKAFWMKVQDTVQATVSGTGITKILERLGQAKTQKLEGPVVKVIENAGKHFALGDEEQKSVLQHLIAGGDLSKYGLANAITRTSQDVESYDRATELEYTGSDVIYLGQKDWSMLNEAA